MKPSKRKQQGRGPPALRIHAAVSRHRASTGGSLPPPGPPLAIFPVRGVQRLARMSRPWQYVFSLLFALLPKTSYQEILL
jgi:hypothetical protein